MRAFIRGLVHPLRSDDFRETEPSVVKMNLARDGRLAFLVIEKEGERHVELFFPHTTAGPYWPEGNGFDAAVALLGNPTVVGAGTFADADARTLPWSGHPNAANPEHVGWRWAGVVNGTRVRTRPDDAMQLMYLCDRVVKPREEHRPVVIRVPNEIPPTETARYLDLAIAAERRKHGVHVFTPVALPDGSYLLHFTS